MMAAEHPDEWYDDWRLRVTTAELQALVELLRPLVYVDGAYECCDHSDEEKLALADAVLKWWSDTQITIRGEPDPEPRL